MEIDKNRLLSEALKAGISQEKASQLWELLSEGPSQESPKFDLSNILYYIGAFIIIISLGWFGDIALTRLGAGSFFAITIMYMLISIALGSILWQKKEYQIPGGIFITISVCIIPVAVYAFQLWMGWWTGEEPWQYTDFYRWVSGNWFFMEAATLIGCCIALIFFRFPLLTAPLYFTLWFMSMDITPLLFGSLGNSMEVRAWVMIVFGVAIIISAYVTDLLVQKDFAFWGYLFGVITFWVGLCLLDWPTEYHRFVYLLINVGLVLLSVLFQRTIFLICGALGIFGYLSYVFYRYFENTLWFPPALICLGVLIIYAGVLYQKQRKNIEAFILNGLPQSVKRWLPKTEF